MSDAKWVVGFDEGYFGLWSVAPEGKHPFGAYYHVRSKQEADGLCDLLNTQAARIAALESELKALREQEPVAWRLQTQVSDFITRNELIRDEYIEQNGAHVTPYYAAPVPAQDDARDAERCMNLILTAESRGFGVAYMKGVAQGYLNRHGTDAAILAAKGGHHE